MEIPVKIRSAKSGQYLIAEKASDVFIKTETEKNSETLIVIRDVLLIPGLELNLLSVRKLEMNSFKVLFENGQGKILKTNKVIAVAERKNKLYELLLVGYVEAFLVKDSKSELWHRRLGHISYENLKKLSKIAEGIDANLGEELDKCQICIEDKQTRQLQKRPLQLIHSDLFGPVSPESYNEKRYVLEFIANYTYFSVVYVIKSKSEVFRYFKIYEAMVTAHFNRKISRLRCDNGREYMSNETKDYFEQKGIQMETTIRYTPQQNGVAERMNRTVIERARCMLIDSKLSKSLGSESVMAAVYLIKRNPTRFLDGKTPAELWFESKPNLRKLKIFGCIA